MITIPTNKTIGVRRLIYELRQRWPEAVAAWGAEGVVYVDGVPADDVTDLEDVIEAHDHALLAPDEAKEVEVASVLLGAEASAENIPGWARWSEQEVIDYIQNNVTDLASAKVVLVALARMVVALRNAQWPRLEAGH